MMTQVVSTLAHPAVAREVSSLRRGCSWEDTPDVFI